MASSAIIRISGRVGCCLLSLAVAGSIVSDRAQTEPKQDVEVLRVNTELVQSPVRVFDKQGHFVDGLTSTDFELRIDGKPHPVLFFDRVTAGTAAEAQKIEASRNAPNSPTAKPSKPSVYGRSIIFFIDDLHLSAESINRTRASLRKFIDESMGQNDRVLITTGSGQLGFLQQLTDNKDVLRLAADRLRARQFLTPDDERPPMGPYQALQIEANDSNVLKYYVEIYFADVVQNMNKEPPEMPGNKNSSAIAQSQGESARRIAEIHIRSRARNILNQYNAISTSSFAALRYVMASSLAISGQKLIFVISDGFYLNRNIAGESQKLSEITSAATRAGAVIYSIQSSGLSSSYPDARADLRQGPRMPMELPRAGNDQALQAPLYTLAVDSGGRALFNSNSMDDGIRQALKETSEYYLLAWRPDTDEQKAGTFKAIQVVLKNHPELSVRMHKGYLISSMSSNAAAAVEPLTSDPKRVEEKITEALEAEFPATSLALSLNVRYEDKPVQGPQIMVGTEVATVGIFRGAEDSQPHLIDLVGVALNDQGKTVASFRGQLKADPSTGQSASISQVTELKTKPGLYQLRVAARDQSNGLVGSATEWIMVPELKPNHIALSSIFVGNHRPQGAVDAKVPLSINHHFSPDSRLRFFASIYNALRANGGAPDVTVQMQISRDDKVIATGPLVKVATDGVDDLTRIPYAAEVSLRMLSPGVYILRLTASDNVAKSQAAQQVRFVIE